jgi:hypothetical protein
MKQPMRILMMLSCTFACFPPNTSAALAEYRLGEPALRAAVLKSVTPKVPEGFRPVSPAVAVVEVELTNKGELIAVGVLEAPTSRAATELQKAVQQWRFGQVGGEPGHYRGKLTFYFVTIDGIAHVFGSNESNESSDEPHRASPVQR